MTKENQINSNEEVSLKELIYKLKEFYLEILKNKVLLVFMIVALMLLFGYRSRVAIPNYSAKLTFMLNTTSGSAGGLGGLLGQFGIGNKGEYSKDKIMSLNKSRRIIENVLFEKEVIHGEEKILANHLIHHLDTLGKWAASNWKSKLLSSPKELAGFRFNDNNLENFNLLSKKALKTIYYVIVGRSGSSSNSLMSNGYDDDSGVMYITTSTNDPDLSIILTNRIFDKLSEFYVEKTIEKQKITYEILKEKNDSILNLLVKKETALAVFEDRSQGLWNKKSNLKKKLLTNDIRKLSLMYGELIKNLEIADFSLKNKTPFVQAIDRPILPLDSDKESVLNSMMKGGILGLFLGVFLVVIRKIFRDIML